MSELLAKEFAALQGQGLLKFRKEPSPDDETIELNVIILEDGRKFKFTNEQLDEEIKKLEKSAPSAASPLRSEPPSAKSSRSTTRKGG